MVKIYTDGPRVGPVIQWYRKISNIRRTKYQNLIFSRFAIAFVTSIEVRC